MINAYLHYFSTGSVPHSPTNDRKMEEEPRKEIKLESKEEPESFEDKLAAKRRTLQRSHTIGVGSRPLPNKALLKGWFMLCSFICFLDFQSSARSLLVL